ncbi:MAG: hypothetical protein WA632_04080 [Gallionella sp.]
MATIVNLPGVATGFMGRGVLTSGRKSFQKPINDGIALFNTTQDVYSSDMATIACR